MILIKNLTQNLNSFLSSVVKPGSMIIKRTIIALLAPLILLSPTLVVLFYLNTDEMHKLVIAVLIWLPTSIIAILMRKICGEENFIKLFIPGGSKQLKEINRYVFLFGGAIILISVLFFLGQPKM